MHLFKEIKNSLPLVRWKRLLVAAVLFWTPVIIFSQIADEIHERDPVPFDAAFLVWLNSHSNPVLDRLIVGFTELGGVLVVVTFIIVVTAYLWLQRQRRNAVFTLIAIGGAGLVNFVLKHLFGRDRPELWQTIISEQSYSFPSGHAMLSSAIAFTLMLLFWNTRARWWVVTLGALYVFGIGMTRLYLGVHYPTDVVAGWCVSFAWVLITYTIIMKGGFLRRQQVKDELAGKTKT